MAQVEAIVFDAFGTLLKPAPHRGAYHELARMAGGDARDFRALALKSNVPIETLARGFGIDARRARSLKDMLAAEADGCALYPEADQVLRVLGRLPFAVCSNIAHGYCAAVKRLVQGAHAFVFSCEVGMAKPEPGIYRAAAEALATHPSRILFVGDTPRMDVDGPLAFGMKAAGIRRSEGKGLMAAVAPYVPLALSAEGPRRSGTASLHSC